MKTWVKILLGLVVLGIIAAVLGYFFVYNKPHKDIEKAKPEYSLQALALFNEYVTDQTAAGEKYNGKVLEVGVTVTGIESNDTLVTVVSVLNQGMFGDEGIRFTMLEKYFEAARQLEQGSSATIKGYCVGYTGSDVILEKCSIIQ